ncbi:MFS transporter [Cellulomonas soli]|uniref:MFS transporter n=1 Tax=Cellulomonas soli TaxID=931535 RepID=A0A512PEV0_9CELL|nr:MFS transporter [Cellulomonas soli]NYI59471.1 MFS family permease [Cellulomonas soli]GEP69737.1 MFS transporter [Cellulomonas soli]
MRAAADLPAPGPGVRAARAAVSAGFAAQGFVYALVLTSLDSFKDRVGIDDGQVTLVVLGVCVVAALGTWLADGLARTSRGSRLVLVVGLGTLVVAVVLAAIAPTFAALAAAFAVYGLGLGLVDAGTNMQAVSVQRAYGRSLLTGFYASWTVAGIVGALVVSSSGRLPAGVPDGLALLPGTLVAGAAALVVARWGWRLRPVDVTPPDLDAALVDLPAAPVAGGLPDAPADDSAGGGAVVPWGPVLLLGLGVVAFYVADSAVSTWSTIYLGDVLLAPSAVAPLAYAAYLVTTLGSRLAGDRCVRRWGRGAVVRVAALVGAAGLAIVVVAGSVPVGLLGFALAGAGLGPIAPLCFSAAGSLAPGHADAVVARLNVFNYVGAVLGGVLVGALATASTFRVGFVVPVVLALAVASVAGRFGPRTDEPAPDPHSQEVRA